MRVATAPTGHAWCSAWLLFCQGLCCGCLDDWAAGCWGLRGGRGTAWDGSGDDILCLMSCSTTACSVAMFWAICSCLTASCSKLLRTAARSRVIGSSCCIDFGVETDSNQTNDGAHVRTDFPCFVTVRLPGNRGADTDQYRNEKADKGAEYPPANRRPIAGESILPARRRMQRRLQNRHQRGDVVFVRIAQR
jgi:hypothetical protein